MMKTPIRYLLVGNREILCALCDCGKLFNMSRLNADCMHDRMRRFWCKWFKLTASELLTLVNFHFVSFKNL